MKAYILEDNGVQIGDTAWPSILDENSIKREEVFDGDLSSKERDRICMFNLEEYPEFQEVIFGFINVRIAYPLANRAGVLLSDKLEKDYASR